MINLNHSRILLLTLIALLFSIKPNFAQIYKLDLKDIGYPTLGGIGLIHSFSLQKKTPPLTYYQIKQYVLDFKDNPKMINFLDRSSVKQNHKWANTLSDLTLIASAATPIVLFGDREIREIEKIGVMYTQTQIITLAITNLVKVTVKRNRPYVYNEDYLGDPFVKHKFAKARFSFFSGHTSFSAAGTFFTAKVYSDNTQRGELSPIYWASAATLPAVTGFLRYKAGKHFITDVIVGYVIGAMVGILIPELHKL